MAERRTKLVVIDAPNRDKGKHFLIVEKSAYEVEKWAMRAFIAMLRSGVDVSEDIRASGAAGMAAMYARGLIAFQGINYEEIEPLLDEMLECVRVIPDPHNMGFVRDLVLHAPDAASASDIEEVTTLFKLRAAVMEMHVGFFPFGAQSNSQTSETTSTVPRPSNEAPTSREQSPPSSAPNLRPSRSARPSSR